MIFLLTLCSVEHQNYSLMGELHVGMGSCNVGILCMLFPNSFHIPFAYFHLLFSYFHCTNAILYLPPFQSKSNLPVACIWIFSILSHQPLSSFTVQRWASLSSAFLEHTVEISKYSHLWLVCYWQRYISYIRWMGLLGYGGTYLSF